MALAATRTPESTPDGFYSVLQTLSQQGHRQVTRALPDIDRNVEERRQVVTELRRLLAHAQDELAAWETVRAAYTRVLDPDAPDQGDGLRGQAIARVAVDVLRESDRALPIHYRDWYELVRAAGHRVGGIDPLASFLTAVHRRSTSRGDVQPIGGRSGLWTLQEDHGDA